MGKRNKRLTIIFFSLLVINLGFLLVSGSSSSLSFREDLFVVSDTSQISSIRFSREQSDILIERHPEGWILNDKFHADDRLRNLFLSIMQRVQVKKPVVVEKPEDAAEVSVITGEPLTFEVWGNPTRTRTFFSLTGREEAYEVIIPGYSDYLGQIFELNPDQWRDRLIFDGSWRTIQELSLDYLTSDVNDFTIRFDENFFVVAGVSALDSSAVVEYLNQFQYYEANEWISEGRFPKYDSLAKKPPLATLRIEAINREDPVTFDIYPNLENQPYNLVADQHQNLLIIDNRRVKNILKTPSDFAAKD